MRTVSTRLMVVVGLALFLAGVGVGGTLATGNNPMPPGGVIVFAPVAVCSVGFLGWFTRRLYRRS